MPDHVSGQALLWLVGAGPMGVDYAKVLIDRGTPFTTIGRGAESAAQFFEKTGQSVVTGGVAAALFSLPVPEIAIVAVGVEQLYATTAQLVAAGVKKLLIEKPAGLNSTEIADLAAKVQAAGAQAYVAYNRRFYDATLQAARIMEEDGGMVSMTFEFTEWSHRIAVLNKPAEVLSAWLLANSTHVIDVAFHLAGLPTDWRAWREGTLDWHPAARFSGAGKTEHGVLFSYHADWQGPGRWGVDWISKRRRVILRPMEQIQVQEIGSVTATLLPPMDDLDSRFKPGLYRLVQAFLDGQGLDRLPTLQQQALFVQNVHDAVLNGRS